MAGESDEGVAVLSCNHAVHRKCLPKMRTPHGYFCFACVRVVFGEPQSRYLIFDPELAPAACQNGLDFCGSEGVPQFDEELTVALKERVCLKNELAPAETQHTSNKQNLATTIEELRKLNSKIQSTAKTGHSLATREETLMSEIGRAEKEIDRLNQDRSLRLLSDIVLQFYDVIRMDLDISLKRRQLDELMAKLARKDDADLAASLFNAAYTRHSQDVVRKKRLLETMRSQHKETTTELRKLEDEIKLKARPAPELKRKHADLSVTTKSVRAIDEENKAPPPQSSSDWGFGLPLRKAPRFNFR